MSRTRRRLVAAAAALTCAVLGAVAVAVSFLGFGPLDRLAVTETRLDGFVLPVRKLS